jgi:uncharacterized membrane protein required for colicin V production
MWLDLLALGVLGAFALLGALRGGFATGMGLFALVAGYAAAVLGASALAPALASRLRLPDLIALPLAGSGMFVLGFAAVSLLGFALRRAFGFGEGERSPRDRFVGATFGGVRGALVVVLVAYLALWVDAMRATGGTAPLPPVGDSATARATSRIVEAGVSAAFRDAGAAGRVAARVAARPAHALEEWQGVLDSQSVQGLREDPLFWSHVEYDNVDAALNRDAALRLLNDASLRARLADLGVVSDAAIRDAAAFRDELAAVLHEVGPRVRGLRNDPGVQELVNDPEVVAMLQSGDTLRLLAHPGFRALVERVAAKPGPDAEAADAGSL